jgi:hypothetical protein
MGAAATTGVRTANTGTRQNIEGVWRWVTLSNPQVSFRQLPAAQSSPALRVRTNPPTWDGEKTWWIEQSQRSFKQETNSVVHETKCKGADIKLSDGRTASSVSADGPHLAPTGQALPHPVAPSVLPAPTTCCRCPKATFGYYGHDAA